MHNSFSHRSYQTTCCLVEKHEKKSQRQKHVLSTRCCQFTAIFSSKWCLLSKGRTADHLITAAAVWGLPRLLLQISDAELQRATMRSSHLLVDLGVQLGPGVLACLGSPFIETKKGVNDLTRCDGRYGPVPVSGNLCPRAPDTLHLFFHSGCSPCFQLHFVCSVRGSESIGWSHSPLFLWLQEGQINPGLREGPEKHAGRLMR